LIKFLYNAIPGRWDSAFALQHIRPIINNLDVSMKLSADVQRQVAHKYAPLPIAMSSFVLAI